MALNAYIGANKHEARDNEPACFIQGWTHQALMAAAEDQDRDFDQLLKISDLHGDATFLTAEVKRLDEELDAIQKELPDGSLIVQFLTALRRACREAIEEDANLYFFGDGPDA